MFVCVGVLRGDMYMMGSYDQCLDIPHQLTEYCLVSTGIRVPPQLHTPLPLVFSVGMCLPQQCNVTDVNALVYLIPDLYVPPPSVLMPNPILCQSYKNPPYDAKAIIMIFACCVIVCIVLLSTLADLCIQLWRDGTIHRYLLLRSRPKADSNVSDESLLLRPSVDKKQPTKFDPVEWVQAFSLYKNLGTIFSTKQTSAAITCLNGIRVLSILWVIVCHNFVWIFQYTGSDNVLDLFQNMVKRFSFQAISNGFFSVDSFFFLSGLLVSYLTLRQMKRRNGKFPFVMYYVHRYLRLTPVYAFVLFLVWTLMAQLGNGPRYSPAAVPQVENCENYWWTNFLYINNLYPWELGKECIGWSWYLANDMQFFVISPLVIIPMYMFFPLGLAIAMGLLFVSFLSTGVIAGVFDMQANTFAFLAYQYQAPVNQTANSNDLLYTKPWHRIQPYLVGLVLGYVLYKKIRVPFNRYVQLCVYLVMWGVAIVLGMSTVYGLYGTWNGHVPSLAENVVYFMFSRFSFGVALALLVFICHNGYGGWVNSFLSMTMWLPLSRLAFNAYLIHPVVLTVVYGYLRNPLHLTEVELSVYAVGVSVISFAAAFLMTVFVEFPFGNLETAFFKLFGVGVRESTRAQTEVKESTPQKDAISPLRSTQYAAANFSANGEKNEKKM